MKYLNELLTLCSQRVQPSFHVGEICSQRVKQVLRMRLQILQPLRMRVILGNDITGVVLFFLLFS